MLTCTQSLSHLERITKLRERNVNIRPLPTSFEPFELSILLIPRSTPFSHTNKAYNNGSQ